jgi:DNA-binding NtrC family response regulator
MESTMDLGPRYCYLRELGRGGSGRVFLVRDSHLERDLAMKLLHGRLDDAADLRELEREFALLARIDSPRVARAHDFGYRRGRPYFTQEFIAGPHLDGPRRWRQGADLVALMVRAAEAVALLHEQEILHLDVKPSNIIVRRGGPHPGPVLIDFGLFRRGLAAPLGPSLRGSLAYMAPECFRSGPIGAWTDVYALGVTFYQLVAGRLPRWADRTPRFQALAHGDWDADPPPPRIRRDSVPAGIAAIVLKCLALDWAARFRSAQELLHALREVQGTTTVLSPRSTSVGAATVGRDEELARIGRFLDALARNEVHSRLLLVTGPAGMGQSHLLREMKLRAQTRGLRFFLETGYAGQNSAPGALLRCLGVPSGAGARRADAASRWRRFLDALRRPRRSAREDVEGSERRSRHAAEVALAVGAVCEPTVLAVDGLEHWDEVSIELVTDLARRLLAPAEQVPRLAVAIGYREEGPTAPLLSALSRELLRHGAAEVVSLRPLGLQETLRLYRERGGRPDPGADGQSLMVYQESGGCPAKVLALAAASPPGDAPGQQGERVRIAGEASPARSGEAGLVLLVLQLLARPASLREVARITAIPAARVARHLESLQAGSLASEAEPGGVALAWVARPHSPQALERLPPRRVRDAHLRIARSSERAACGPEDPLLLEAVEHFAAAGKRREAVRLGVPAAHYLKATHQTRAALRLFRTLLGMLDAHSEAVRDALVFEVADLHARTGDLDEGIGVLRDLLVSARNSSAKRRRIILKLAALHGRRGDLRRADALFREGLAARQGGSKRSGELSPEERLVSINEHASLKATLGDAEGALDLCAEGLRLARRSRSPRAREAALSLYATRANVSLRRLDFEAAIADYGRALEAAEALGSLGNQAATLNNLGKVYSQCDRYSDAVAAFEEAQRISLRTDDVLALVAIRANLAILHSKLGDYRRAEKALEEARRLGQAAGRRERFILSHASGLSRLFQGRYAQARPDLESAIEQGKSLGDLHVVEFEEVYRAEALAFEGQSAEAEAELRRLGATALSLRVRRMALARLAFVSALGERSASADEAAQAMARLDNDPVVPFLDAWDAVYLGWADALLGRVDVSLKRLRTAEAFFARHRLRAMEGFARLLQAQALLSASEGDAEPASRCIAAVETHGNALLCVWKPLLQAQALLQGSSNLLDKERCAALLSEAGAALASNPLSDAARRLDELRRLLAAPRKKGRRGRVRALEPRSSTRAAIRAASPATPLRNSLVARSSAMRRLLAALDRLRDSELPLLVRGETGSGKELVARVLHEESPRRGGPFVVFDCAAVPESLLEVELSGAAAGAYTDQVQDRRGVLDLARGGTVLLESVDALSVSAQAKLLRIASERTVRPLGSEDEVPLDVRFVASSSKDLRSEVEAGRFRADLFHRLVVVDLHVPPLRERPEDLRPLAERFLSEAPGPRLRLGEDAWKELRLHSWPGNVRELKNVIARLRLEVEGRASGADVRRVLGAHEAPSVVAAQLLDAEKLPVLQERLERDYILYHYRRLGGSTPDLCRLLGLSRRQLYNRLKRLGVTLREERRKIQTCRGANRPARVSCQKD